MQKLEQQLNIDSFQETLNEIGAEEFRTFVTRIHNDNEDKDNDQFIERKIYRVRHNNTTPGDLPKGYCFMGGVARNALFDVLGEDIRFPRDIDVVGIQDFEPDPSLIGKLSKEWMESDYSFGKGVKIESLEGYFRSRDFSINEVLADNDYLYFTKEALEDSRDKIIRPTLMETQKSYVPSRLVMRALRMHVLLNDAYGYSKLEGREDWEWEFSNISPKNIALQLSKAFEVNDAIAYKFYQELLSRNIIQRDDFDENNKEEISKANDPYTLAHKLDEYFKEIEDPFTWMNIDIKRIKELAKSNNFEEQYWKLSEEYNESVFKHRNRHKVKRKRY